MKRFVLIAALAAMVLPAGDARAASVYATRFFTASYSSGPSFVYLTASLSEDLTGANPNYGYAYVNISTPLGNDFGSGILDVALDPTATAGRITGTLTGSAGPITVDLTYVGLSFNSAQPPTVYGQVNPSAQQANAGVYSIKSGSADGTVTSGVGTVPVVGAWSSANYGLAASV